MGKLHELLAVEPDLKSEAQRVTSQTVGLFTDGVGRFTGQIKRYTPVQEDGEKFPDETLELATSVSAELERAAAPLAAWIDAAAQKEVTNQQTKATVMVDGKELLADLPAPALLNLEAKLAEIREIYAKIPTLDPAERWRWDDGQGRFVTEPRTAERTKKTPRNHVLAEATKEHPAQVQVYTEDIRVGTWETTKFSGALTIAEKNKRLGRVDILLRAVKQARQRANDIAVVDVHVGETLFKYINGN